MHVLSALGLVLLSTVSSLASTVPTKFDPVYEAAVTHQHVPAGMILSAFEGLGFTPNTTEELDDGAMDYYHLDFNHYQSIKSEILQKILYDGPVKRTVSTDLVPRQDETNEALSCKFHNQYAYSYTVNIAAGGFCGGIFSGAAKGGVTIAKRRGMRNIRGTSIDTIFSYVWFVPSFAISTACSTLMSDIIKEKCHVSDSEELCLLVMQTTNIV